MENLPENSEKAQKIIGQESNQENSALSAEELEVKEMQKVLKLKQNALKEKKQNAKKERLEAKKVEREKKEAEKAEFEKVNAKQMKIANEAIEKAQKAFDPIDKKYQEVKEKYNSALKDLKEAKNLLPKKSGNRGGGGGKRKDGPGVISSIVEAIEISGSVGVTKNEILEHLVSIFPEKDPDSMMGTIKAQVPTRIRKEKFDLGKTEDERFFKI